MRNGWPNEAASHDVEPRQLQLTESRTPAVQVLETDEDLPAAAEAWADTPLTIAARGTWHVAPDRYMRP